MTGWGFLLLGAYVALGLSPMARRKAGNIAVLLTIAVLTYALVSYHAVR